MFRNDGRAPFPWYARLLLGMCGGVLVGLLATAAALRPSPSGYGTHQQLGLPPCTFQAMVGRGCPSCGMTTSWSHLMRGQIRAGLAANAGGVLMGMVALVAGPWMLLSAARGSWIGGRPNEWVVLAVAGAILAVTLADWTLRRM